MPAELLDSPPDAGLWIPPDALGPDVKIVYTRGRNNGAGPPYYGRKVREIVTTEASHTMGGAGTETPQAFANGEMGSSATLAEVATFPAAASPWKKATLLQSLPLDAMGVGSVALTPWGLTHESSELAGDPNAQPWTPDHLDLKARLTAWLIRNPLGAAGDRRWQKVQIRYQVCSSPYPNTAAQGGLGFHTMFGDCGTEAGGTNPWSLYCKSCPGYYRRGYKPGKFPGVPALPDLPGNFRAYYEAVGQLLAAAPEPAPIEEDTVTYKLRADNEPGTIWVTDGLVKRWENNGAALVVVTDARDLTLPRKEVEDIPTVGPVPNGWRDHEAEAVGRIVAAIKADPPEVEVTVPVLAAPSYRIASVPGVAEPIPATAPGA